MLYVITVLGDRMNPVVKEVLKKINDYGYEAYLVGGAPRDFYMGFVTTDYDICTNAPLDKLKEWFVVIKTNYASSIILFNETKLEVTQFRKEFDYINHRFPNHIEFVSDLKTDLLRRDFIMNTLCINHDGEYIDLLGARDDIDKKIIRSVGNPMIKLEEDALRILRAIRFATILQFSIEKELDLEICELKHLVKNLSYFRKRQELNRIISSKYRMDGFSLLKKYQLLEELELEKVDQVTKDMSLLEVWHIIDPKRKYEYTKEERKILQKLDEA